MPLLQSPARSLMSSILLSQPTVIIDKRFDLLLTEFLLVSIHVLPLAFSHDLNHFSFRVLHIGVDVFYVDLLTLGCIPQPIFPVTDGAFMTIKAFGALVGGFRRRSYQEDDQQKPADEPGGGDRNN